jgi:hypothetical protein
MSLAASSPTAAIKRIKKRVKKPLSITPLYQTYKEAARYPKGKFTKFYLAKQHSQKNGYHHKNKGVHYPGC